MLTFSVRACAPHSPVLYPSSCFSTHALCLTILSVPVSCTVLNHDSLRLCSFPFPQFCSRPSSARVRHVASGLDRTRIGRIDSVHPHHGSRQPRRKGTRTVACSLTAVSLMEHCDSDLTYVSSSTSTSTRCCYCTVHVYAIATSSALQHTPVLCQYGTVQHPSSDEDGIQLILSVCSRACSIECCTSVTQNLVPHVRTRDHLILSVEGAASAAL